jgi:hypothetical protein
MISCTFIIHTAQRGDVLAATLDAWVDRDEKDQTSRHDPKSDQRSGERVKGLTRRELGSATVGAAEIVIAPDDTIFSEWGHEWVEEEEERRAGGRGEGEEAGDGPPHLTAPVPHDGRREWRGEGGVGVAGAGAERHLPLRAAPASSESKPPASRTSASPRLAPLSPPEEAAIFSRPPQRAPPFPGQGSPLPSQSPRAYSPSLSPLSPRAAPTPTPVSPLPHGRVEAVPLVLPDGFGGGALKASPGGSVGNGRAPSGGLPAAPPRGRPPQAARVYAVYGDA